MLIQAYPSYSVIEQETWSILYNRQVKAVTQFAYNNFLPSLQKLHFTEHQIPSIPAINQRLLTLTGWSVYPVPGLIDNAYFFEQMHQKRFGSTTFMRTRAQIDYLEEPDMFHDVFGHVPLLADANICTYLSGLALVCHRFIDNETIVEAIARLYWYSIEFGLIWENGTLKIYGAGILSSIAETEYCLSGKPVLSNFDIEKIIETPYIKDHFQEQYFVLNSFYELTEAIVKLEAWAEKEADK